MTSPDLFWLVFRYANRGPTSVSGRVSVREEGKFATCANCECVGAAPAHPPATPGIHSHLSPTQPKPTWGPRVGGEAWPGLLALGSTAGGGPWAVCRVSPPPPGTEQSQPVAFPPSTEPAFITVPQRGFGEPFVLNPGTWALLVEAEGVLLVRWG